MTDKIIVMPDYNLMDIASKCFTAQDNDLCAEIKCGECAFQGDKNYAKYKEQQGAVSNE